MAHMPNLMHVTVTNAEVAHKLESMADAYDELAQICRRQAESLRTGFEIALEITAKPAVPIVEAHTSESVDMTTELFDGLPGEEQNS